MLITGSFNWTRQAVLNNQENLIILDSQQAVSGGAAGVTFGGC
jgi:phosphatidylserine/phosphatidylglycerophosphate/cardiolipin synthase-like enzyme